MARANTGVVITGSGANTVISGGVCGVCATGMYITNNAIASINSVTFKINANDVVQDGASQATIAGCSFEITEGSTDVEIQVSGAGTLASLIGCEFNGTSTLGIPEATGIVITNNASVEISGCQLQNYTTGIQIGASTDTSSTALLASGLIINNCATNIIQQGLATLNLNSSTASSSAIGG